LIPGKEKRFFSFPECPSWPPIQCTVGAYTPGGKGVKLQNKADHSLPFSAEKRK